MRKTNGREAPARTRGAAALLTALLASMLVAAGCGSDDSNDSASSGGTTSGQAASGADVAAAEKLVTQYETRPTKIPATKPIGKPIPKGKKVFNISCGVSSCVEAGKLSKEATDALGWSTTVVTTDGTPEKVSNGIRSAARSGADAIWMQTADPAVLSAPINEVKGKGIFFSTCCSVAKMPDEVDFTTLTADQIGPYGAALAAKVVAGGKDQANTLYVDLPAFAILTKVAEQFKAKYSELCSKCDYAKLDIPPTAIGKDVPDRILSYLRSHPGVNHLVLSEITALLPGLVPALKTAGYGPDKIKIVGQGGNATVFDAIRTGDVQAITPNNDYLLVWAEVDAMARHFTGQKPDELALPIWMVTKENLPDNGGKNNFPFVEDYRAQWEKLWGISS